MENTIEPLLGLAPGGWNLSCAFAFALLFVSVMDRHSDSSAVAESQGNVTTMPTTMCLRLVFSFSFSLASASASALALVLVLVDRALALPMHVVAVRLNTRVHFRVRVHCCC